MKADKIRVAESLRQYKWKHVQCEIHTDASRILFQEKQSLLAWYQNIEVRVVYDNYESVFIYSYPWLLLLALFQMLGMSMIHLSSHLSCVGSQGGGYHWRQRCNYVAQMGSWTNLFLLHPAVHWNSHFWSVTESWSVNSIKNYHLPTIIQWTDWLTWLIGLCSETRMDALYKSTKNLQCAGGWSLCWDGHGGAAPWVGCPSISGKITHRHSQTTGYTETSGS